jgi:ATP-dependent DNA helicase PIF1
MLLNLPLCDSSREVQNVDLRPLEQQPHIYRYEGEEARRGKSPLEHYMNRPATLEDVNLLRFLQSYRIGSPYTKRAGKDRVLNMFPRYRPDEVEDYGRVKLMLHHPFREVNDLKHIRGIHDRSCATFADAWAIADELCEYPSEDRDGLDKSLPEPEPSVHEGTPDDADGDDADSVKEDWELLARQLPARDGTGVDTSEQLGKRAFDLQYAWDDKIGTHPDLTAD